VKQLEKLTHLTINRIILYTPTYRDYETSESEKHSIFGFPVDAKDMNRLTSILEDHSAILIYKLHPWQEKTCIINSNSIRLLNYRDIPFSCNLYSLMAEADALITDYTSTYFDFLHRDKPVIFNFYDLKEYEEMRGLSYQPVDCIAAGHIITDAHQLIDAISSVLNGQDPYKNKRNEMHRFFNYHHDGNSAERICRQILHNQ
jgi:CDP-glycerol glycerophosphotransferase (TagB/SpsB family)